MTRRLLLLSTILATAAIAAPASANAAGTYEVSACNFALEGANNSWSWSSTDPSSSGHYAEHVNCPDRKGGNGGRSDQEGGLSTTDALGLSNGAAPGTSAGWSFTAPAGTTIAGISYERYIGHVFDSSNDWAPALRADGVIVAGESCLDTVENSESCYVGGPPEEGVEPETITGLSAHQLTLGIVCQAAPEDQCVTGASQHSTWAAMYGSTVTINDPTTPTLTTPTGALWNEAGYHKGTQTVTISAEDTGGGIASITLAADGHTIDTYTASCDYTYPKPCPTATGNQTLTLPTTDLADGTHTITLAATDAAGTQITSSRQITVANDAPLPPTALTATPTTAGGGTFTVRWSDSTDEPTPITGATYQVCAGEALETCGTPTAAPAAGPATITVPGPGTWTIAVWLTNAADNTNQANAARTTVTVAAPVLVTPVTPTNAGPGTNPGGTTAATGTSQPGTTPTRPKLRVAAVLHGHKLIVRLTGGGSKGTVDVTYTLRYKRKLLESGARRAHLHAGRLEMTLRVIAARKRATIRLFVHADGYPPQEMTIRIT